MMRKILPLISGAMLAVLTSCMPTAPVETASRGNSELSDLPQIKMFNTPRPSPPIRSNSQIAKDFLDLSFSFESGLKIPYLTKFEGQISVSLFGQPNATLSTDLSKLLHRLRTEAGIDIVQTDSPEANILIHAVSARDIRRSLPNAACMVAPNVNNILEYRKHRNTPHTSWRALKKREKVSVFIPYDVTPQLARDCLHEELAQALGPLNDLYSLPNSVFNDDNVHTVLTGFDMLILKLYYAAQIKSGMSKAEVAGLLPRLLATHNPKGQRPERAAATATPKSWSQAISQALFNGTPNAQKLSAAERALQIAASKGWQDHRRGLSHFLVGRLVQGSDPQRAFAELKLAEHFYQQSPGLDLHRAHVTQQIASFAISSGQGDAALAALGPAIKAAAKRENASLLASLLLLRAEALELTGRASQAKNVRLDSLGWARYGFGSEKAVRQKMREIAALNPLK